MTPKEKADSIFQQMYKILWHTNSDPIHCKQCSLVAVDEILNALPILRPAQDAVNYLENYSTIQTQLDNISYYWIDVKAEIEQLDT